MILESILSPFFTLLKTFCTIVVILVGCVTDIRDKPWACICGFI